MKTRSITQQYQEQDLDVLLATIDNIDFLPTTLRDIIQMRIDWRDEGLCEFCGGRIKERSESDPFICAGGFVESHCVRCGEFYGTH